MPLRNLRPNLKEETKVGFRHFKGSQKDFEKIQDNKTFRKVEGLYLDENDNIYFIVEDKPDKVYEFDFIKKIWYNKIKRKK